MKDIETTIQKLEEEIKKLKKEHIPQEKRKPYDKLKVRRRTFI